MESRITLPVFKLNKVFKSNSGSESLESLNIAGGSLNSYKARQIFHQLTAHLRLDFIIKLCNCPFKQLSYFAFL